MHVDEVQVCMFRNYGNFRNGVFGFGCCWITMATCIEAYASLSNTLSTSHSLQDCNTTWTLSTTDDMTVTLEMYTFQPRCSSFEFEKVFFFYWNTVTIDRVRRRFDWLASAYD